MSLRHRALHFRMRGLKYREIGPALQREYDLAETPPMPTVYDWVQIALREGTRANAEAAALYLAIVMERAEAIVRTLMPIVLDKVAIERTTIIDGQTVRVIEESELRDCIQAAQEIRKQHDSVLRAMRGNRANQESPKAEAFNSQLFVINAVRDHMAKPEEAVTSERAAEALELTRCDPRMDDW